MVISSITSYRSLTIYSFIGRQVSTEFYIYTNSKSMLNYTYLGDWPDTLYWSRLNDVGQIHNGCHGICVFNIKCTSCANGRWLRRSLRITEWIDEDEEKIFVATKITDYRVQLLKARSQKNFCCRGESGRSEPWHLSPWIITHSRTHDVCTDHCTHLNWLTGDT